MCRAGGLASAGVLDNDAPDHATREIASGSKPGFDAAKKRPDEGCKRPSPRSGAGGGRTSAAGQRPAPSGQPQYTPAPQPPGEVPPGKVWSVEHGHWHDAPAPTVVTPVPGLTPAPGAVPK